MFCLILWTRKAKLLDVLDIFVLACIHSIILYTLRMPHKRIPSAIFFGQLSDAKRNVGRPKLRFKDVLKRDLADFEVPQHSWVSTAQDQKVWKIKLTKGAKKIIHWHLLNSNWFFGTDINCQIIYNVELLCSFED